MVGPGDRNEELRYSLRSLAAHVPHDRVWIAGHRPPWVTGVEHLPVSATGSRYARSAANLAAACAHPDVSDEFVLFNDDFFVVGDMPDGPLHRGPIGDMVAGLVRSGYRAAVVSTWRILQQLGHRNPMSYELHMPMRCDKAGMGEALRLGLKLAAPLPRTLYGVMAGLGGRQVPDCKIHDLREGIPAGAWCVSTSDRSFAAGLVGRQVRDMFGEPCRYEREGA